MASPRTAQGEHVRLNLQKFTFDHVVAVAGSTRDDALSSDSHYGATSVDLAAPGEDLTGSTGASIFDFEGDGFPEVVYLDEIEMLVFDGRTGEQKFYSSEHASNTMFDYPVIADVDADGHAEIVACHNGYSSVLSVYGDRDNSWAPARPVWNQHAYHISNVNDDGSIPADPIPSFADTNTWHSAISTDGQGLTGLDLQAEIVDVCLDDCEQGVVQVTVRALNRSSIDAEAGVWLSLYAVSGADLTLLETVELSDPVASAWSSEGISLAVDAQLLVGAESLRVVADDDGTGAGQLEECSEANNSFLFDGPFCE